MARAPEIPALVSKMLASGGDRRIWTGLGRGTNIYGASPYPREMLAYSATTANDISFDAFAHLCDLVLAWPMNGRLGARDYAFALERLRQRVLASYGISPGTDIVFAPSGTDLEFVALHLAGAKFGKPVSNIILGLDEVGSGCGLAASGCYFAEETALADNIIKGSVVRGLEGAEMIDIPVRDKSGISRSSRSVCEDVQHAAAEAIANGRQPLIHIVHGSKTGLVLPDISGIDALRSHFGDELVLVVDACQARISGSSIRAYLARGAIVFITGSKFMGGPPFSGLALVPSAFSHGRPLPKGFNTLFRRAEWPRGWPGRETLSDTANPGLLLRLEAAFFELERFERLDPKLVNMTIAAFSRATRELAETLGASLVQSSTYVGALESATMATLDLSPLPGAPNFRAAGQWQRILAARGIRLGQPVKCLQLPDGQWAGTLRISLSMPTIGVLAGLSAGDRQSRISFDMNQIANVLGAASKSIAA